MGIRGGEGWASAARHRQVYPQHSRSGRFSCQRPGQAGDGPHPRSQVSQPADVPFMLHFPAVLHSALQRTAFVLQTRHRPFRVWQCEANDAWHMDQEQCRMAAERSKNGCTRPKQGPTPPLGALVSYRGQISPDRRCSMTPVPSRVPLSSRVPALPVLALHSGGSQGQNGARLEIRAGQRGGRCGAATRGGCGLPRSVERRSPPL